VNIINESESSTRSSRDRLEIVEGDLSIIENDSTDVSGDTEMLIRRIGELVNAARPMPLSASAMINREELLELVDQALLRLPDELRSARWLMKEREEYLAKSHRDGEDIINAARARAGQMVQRTEVVKAAELRARQLVDRAEAETRRMRNETEDYCDQKLGSFEIVLERTLRTVNTGREKLRGKSAPKSGASSPTTPVPEHANGVNADPGPVAGEDGLNGELAADAVFFDQDTRS